MPEGPPKPEEPKPVEKKEELKTPLELAHEIIEEKRQARERKEEEKRERREKAEKETIERAEEKRQTHERKRETRKEKWGETKEKAIEKGKIVFEKTGEFSEKAKEFLSNKDIQKQIGKTLVGTTATILGIKSVYDVPVYLRQRFKVRGIFGKGGLEAATEELLARSQKMHEKTQEKEQKEEKGEVRDAIKDLNKRLKMTREGEIKGSEQRKLIAKILRENRVQEKATKEERGAEVKKILDEYTTTKVTGMQAIRESANTAFVASGAFLYRPVAYGVLEGVERYQRLTKEAKKKGERVSVLKDVLVGGIKETFLEAAFKDVGDKERAKLQKGISAIRAWGRIARYAGMTGAALHPETISEDQIDKILNTFSGKDTLGKIANNFQGNIERMTESYSNILKKPFEWGGEEAAEGLRGTEGMPATEELLFAERLEYQGGKSIWGEGERQLETRFKEFSGLGGGDEKAAEALKTYNIDRIKDTIVDHPQKYGLPEDVDVNKLTVEQLKNIKWDEAFKDTFEDKGLTKELSAEKIEGVLKNNKTILQGVRQRLTGIEKPKEPPLPSLVLETAKKGGGEIEFKDGSQAIIGKAQEIPGYKDLMLITVEEGGLEKNVIYSEKTKEPVQILDEGTTTVEARRVMDKKVDEFNKTKEALIEKLVKGTAEVSPPIENVEEQLKEWNITPEGWGKEDQLKFWTEHLSLDKKELGTIFDLNSKSGNVLSPDIIQKYYESGFTKNFKGLSDDKLVDLIKIYEHPEGKVPLARLIGEDWTKSGLFNAVEWKIEDGNLKVNFDVKNNAVDVDLLINKDGTVAVDGHGFQNWPLDTPSAPLTNENLQKAMEFINKTDGTGAVAVSEEINA